MAAIRLRIESVFRMDSLIRKFEENPLIKADQLGTERYDIQIADRREEIAHCQRFKQRLYENLQDGAIDRKDYDSFRKNYEKRIEEAENVIRKAEKERAMMESREIGDRSWMESFLKYQDIQEIDRMAVVELIEKVVIRSNHQIEVHFRDDEEYEILERFLRECEIEEEAGWV